MKISTKKGDAGYTRTLSGKRIPKFHLVTETAGLVIAALISTIVLILLFHKPDISPYQSYLKNHMEEMSKIQNQSGYFHLWL